MSLVSIDASPKQLSKLRNGHRVRIKRGTGFNLVVHPDRMNTISRCFDKGKGMEIQLSPEELMANQEHEPSMQGSGIFSTVKHHAKRAASVAYDMAKPMVHHAAKHLATAAITSGAAALTAVQPELAPAIALGAYGLTNAAHAKIDQMHARAPTFQSNVGGTHAPAATTLQGQVQQNKMYQDLNNHIGTNYGNLAQATLGNAQAHKARAIMEAESIPTRFKARNQFGGQGLWAGGSSSGGGLWAGNCSNSATQFKASPAVYPVAMRGGSLRREAGLVGRGGNLLANATHLPPALQSQPLSANFQFQYTLPPSYQRFSKGSGIYA